jgi:SAM-dependent methyltransferase
MSKPFVDYERHGHGYALHRQPDPDIEAAIVAALGTSQTVVNVGAGAGSYEPMDRWVLAIEPSAVMRSQRPPNAAPAIDARAESLPLDDDSVDAAMACVTIHHWDKAETGLREMRRVARGPVVVFTFDLDSLPPWQQHYFAEAIAIEQPRFPPVQRVAEVLGGRCRIQTIPTPGECRDGFFEAFWRRPELLLDPSIRASQSVWKLLPAGSEERIMDTLAADLRSGAWDEQYGHLRARNSFDGALRLVISEAQ